VRVLASLLIAAALLAPSGAAASSTVTVGVHYSRFSPATIVVPRGVPVTIVIRNDDPIDHEWIVGTPDVHARHRTGTEPAHEHRATEVSVPARETRTTVVSFAETGTYQVICHLPGHERYGMVGTLRVVP
jgi:uncharacterized cupredoxin-like copper-binding protein